jgi:hypothetical protein
MAFFSEVLMYGGLILQLIALVFLMRGPLTRYFPLFLYILAVVVVTLTLLGVYRTKGLTGELYFNVFWGGEILMDLLLFLLVISLTIRALEGSPVKTKAVRMLGAILLLTLVIPFVAFNSQPFGRHWNQSVAQLFNFGAALMNLVLWSAFVVSKKRDRQLLTVSAGLGVMVAGAALMLGVRQFTNQTDALRAITDYVYRVGQVAGPAVWCYAFWPYKRRNSSPATPFKMPDFKAPTGVAG